jgi:hypothetical protein
MMVLDSRRPWERLRETSQVHNVLWIVVKFAFKTWMQRRTVNVDDVGKIGNTPLREFGCFDIEIRSGYTLKSRCRSGGWNGFKIDGVWMGMISSAAIIFLGTKRIPVKAR